jgi:hypothetical protein
MVAWVAEAIRNRKRRSVVPRPTSSADANDLMPLDHAEEAGQSSV